MDKYKTKEQLLEEVAVLRQINKVQSNVIEDLEVGFFSLDKEWRFTFINEHAEQYFVRYTKENLIGKNIWDTFPKINKTELFAKYHEAISNQKPVHFKINSLYTNTWHTIHAYPVIEGLSIYFEDITENKNTERKKAEEEIQQMKIRVHEIINSITDGFYALDKNLCFTFANEKTTETFSKTGSEILGKKLTEVIPKDTARSVKGYYLKALKNDETINFEMRGPKGEWFQTNIYPIKDGLSVFFQDVTERKVFQHEIARLDRLHLIGQMSAGIGHEIRNPMTTVRGFLQMLGVSETDSKKRDYYELMIEELDRANSIITEFLSLAKDKVVNMKPASLNVILNTLYPLLTADAIKQDKRVVLNKGDIFNIPLNEKEVRQLVYNLVRNGLEAMPPGGVLSIGTYTVKDEIILYVKDEGTGIQPEIFEKLGNPFVTTKDTGTGLGLATCFSIAHRHNAKIDVETASTGTTFFVRFNLPKKRVTAV